MPFTKEEWERMAADERRWSAQMERGRAIQGWVERHEDADGLLPEEWGLLAAAVAVLMMGFLGIVLAALWLVPWLRLALAGP